MRKSVPDFLQYFGITCFLLVPVYCGLERTCTPEVKARGPRGSCGRALTELLQTACMLYGGYNSDDIFKRSINNHGGTISDQVGTELLKREDIRAQLKDKIASKREAFSFLVKRTQYREQGVVCECCYFQCRFRELTDYCANGNSRRLSLSFFHKRSHHSNLPLVSSAENKPSAETIDSVEQITSNDARYKQNDNIDDINSRNDITSP